MSSTTTLTWLIRYVVLALLIVPLLARQKTGQAEDSALAQPAMLLVRVLTCKKAAMIRTDYRARQ